MLYFGLVPVEPGTDPVESGAPVDKGLSAAEAPGALVSFFVTFIDLNRTIRTIGRIRM